MHGLYIFIWWCIFMVFIILVIICVRKPYNTQCYKKQSVIIRVIFYLMVGLVISKTIVWYYELVQLLESCHQPEDLLYRIKTCLGWPTIIRLTVISLDKTNAVLSVFYLNRTFFEIIKVIRTLWYSARGLS